MICESCGREMDRWGCGVFICNWCGKTSKEVKITTTDISAETIINIPNYNEEPKEITCQRCGKNPATMVFSEGVMAYVHGAYQNWCELCVCEVQLENAKKSAERIPELEKRIAELKNG